MSVRSRNNQSMICEETMSLKLLYSVPAKRFEPHQSLCDDGRGGWTFSQVNVDRVVSQLEDYYLLFGFGVLVENALDDDFVTATKLTARMDGEVIGVSELVWESPNRMWGKEGSDAIFEWAQTIEMQPTHEGLITVSIDVNLKCQEAQWLSVEGNAYCRLTLAKSGEIPALEKRLAGRLRFWWQSLFQKAFWPRSKFPD